MAPPRILTDEQIGEIPDLYVVADLTMEQIAGRYSVSERTIHTLVAQGGVEKIRDFWRGAVDGDGTVGFYRDDICCLNLVGASEAFITQFRDFLEAEGVQGRHSILQERTEGSLGTNLKYGLRLTHGAAIDAARLLYANGSPALARKARIAEAMTLGIGAENVPIVDDYEDAVCMGRAWKRCLREIPGFARTVREVPWMRNCFSRQAKVA